MPLVHQAKPARSRIGVAVRLLLQLGLPLLAVGCLVGPDFKRPETPLPAKWSAKDDPRIASQRAADGPWWKSFNDPVLDRLVELAYRQNLSLQVAGLRIVEARAQLGIATGEQFPQVQELFGSAEAIGLTKPQAGRLQSERNFSTYQLGFDAVWELDFWGKYRRGVEASAANLLAIVADYYYAIVSLTAEVARTYTTVRTFEVLIDQANTNVQLQEEGLRIAEARFRNGVTSELDVTQASALLESTRGSVPSLQIALYQARNALSTLLGQPAGTIDALLAGPKQIPNAPENVSLSVPAELLRRRPDIKSAELYAAAQCARIGIAKAELYPSFTLFGSVGLQASTVAGGGAFFSANSLAYSFGPRISLPFFNYGRLSNGVRVEDARFQQLLASYRNTVLKAAQEVEDALAGFLNARDAALFEERSVIAAQRSQDIAVVQYREGAVDYQRVLDAQRVLLEQQQRLAQTRSDVIINVVALYKALGGGWQMRQGDPIVPASTQRQMVDRTDWGDMLSQPRAPEKKLNTTPVKQ